MTDEMIQNIEAEYFPIDWEVKRRRQRRQRDDFFNKILASPHDPEDEGGLTPPEGTFNSKICPDCDVPFIENLNFGTEDESGKVDRFYMECPRCGARPY